MFDLSIGHLQKMIGTVKLLGAEVAPFEEFKMRATSHSLKEDNFLLEIMIELDILVLHEVKESPHLSVSEHFIEFIDLGWKAIGREIAWYYIRCFAPSWSINLHSGFDAFRKKIDSKINTKQLFRSLALLPQNTEIGDEVAVWWTRAVTTALCSNLETEMKEKIFHGSMKEQERNTNQNGFQWIQIIMDMILNQSEKRDLMRSSISR